MAAAYNKTDYCSLSNTDDTISQHVHLEWVLDFTENIISGSARHSMKIVTEGVTAVIFDCSALVVESVYINHQETTFEISGSVPGLGSKLIVSIPEGFREENTYFDVLVNYSTSKTASAIQWLDKEATKGALIPTSSRSAKPYMLDRCFHAKIHRETRSPTPPMSPRLPGASCSCPRFSRAPRMRLSTARP